LVALQPLGLQFHFFPEQLPFLLQAGRCVLGQHGQAGGSISQSAADAGGQAAEGGLEQGLGRAHGLTGILAELCQI
jgi:hypothetical protein